jgi:hypothetical protein
MTDEELKAKSTDLAIEAGYPDTKNSIRLVNPELFARFKYLTRADAEELMQKNQEYWQPVLLNLKTALANDPFVDQEKLTKKLMYAYFQSAGDDLVKEQSQMGAALPGADMGADTFGKTVQNKALAGAAINAVQ